MFTSAAFLPGYPTSVSGPLSRFLPPIPNGAVSSWLKTNISPGALVIDPFGSSPRMVTEAAQSGYRIIVAANNPVTQLLIELYSLNVSQEQLRTALANLAALRRGQERIEPLIRALYTTQCEKCGSEVEAHTYIWERGAAAPYAKIYACPNCGDAEPRPVNDQDIDRAAHFASDKLHRARALERIAPVDDPDRPHAVEALDTYLPRAVYALFILINKLEGMSIDPLQRKILEGLLLNACDHGNCLWAFPVSRARPKSLSVPPRYRENNIWMALEVTYQELASATGESEVKPVAFSRWPDLPPESGGITLYEGRFKGLIDSINDLKIGCVIGAIPRPNQAFWTLSALWAGWLWGREAVAPIKNVLRRRRYDWSWHTSALHSLFENMSKTLLPGIPFFGLVGEAEASYLSSVMIAAANAGLKLTGLALRADSGQANIIWQIQKPALTPIQHTNQEIVHNSYSAALNYLVQRGEPASYIQIHTAALVSLDAEQQLSMAEPGNPNLFQSPADTFTQISGLLESAFTYRSGFLRYGGSEKSLEIGRWWRRDDVRKPSQHELPLADRVELSMYQILKDKPGLGLAERDWEICELYKGLLTPSFELVSTCLQSYGIEQPEGSDQWHLRSEDDPDSRQADIDHVRQALKEIASRFDYTHSGENPILWTDRNGNTSYVIFVMGTAAFGETITQCSYPPNQCLIALPGSRASLALYKLRRNSHLNQIVNEGWRFIKFRHIYQMVRIPTLSRLNFNEILGQDPIQEADNQMRLL